MRTRWSNFWFLNGGGIHRSFKYRRWTVLRQLAETLPRLAWNEQQKRIDSLFAAIEHGDERHRKWLKDKIEEHFSRISEAEGEE